MNAPNGSVDTAATINLFAIARNDTWVHVYRYRTARDLGATPGAIDFFDTRGHRFDPVFSQSGEIEALKETADPPNVPLVKLRLLAVMQYLAKVVDQRLQAAGESPELRQDALRALPDLTAKSLDECFVELKVTFSNRPAGTVRMEILDSGSAWHNFWCHSF